MGSRVLKFGHNRILYLGVSEKEESVGILRKKGVKDVLRFQEGVGLHKTEVELNIDKSFLLLKECLKIAMNLYSLCNRQHGISGIPI